MTQIEIIEHIAYLEKERNAIYQRIHYWRSKLEKPKKPKTSYYQPPLFPPLEEKCAKEDIPPISPRESFAGAREGEDNKRMKKPSIDDCRAYHAEKGYTWDIEQFYDYYEANGWKVGKNTMKDWRAAMRNWNRNNKHKQSTTPYAAPRVRRASNWVGATEKQIKDFSNAFKRKH